MKFVCDRCQTRYSIADEKVRQKILRIRCKTCGNVIVVKDEHSRSAAGAAPGAAEAGRPAASPVARAAPASGPKAVPSSGPKVPPPPRLVRGADPLGGHVEWYLAVDGEQSGPFSRSEVAKRIHTLGPNKTVHVWKDGMAGWKPPKEVSVVMHELSLLRPPSPPPPPPRPSSSPATAKVAPSHESAVSAPAASSAGSLRGGEPSPLESASADGLGFTEVTTKRSASLREAALASGDEFNEATTKKSKELREAVTASADGFGEPTTKKNKNLRNLASAPPHGESDRTPPPARPLPAVGAKAAVPSFHPGSASLPAPTVSFDVPASPLAARPSASIPVVGPPRSSVGPMVPTPVPLVPPSVPFASPFSRTPTPMAAEPGGPFVVPGGPAVPVLAPGELPTPHPLNVIPLDASLSPPVPAELAAHRGGLAGLFQRQPGLKYVAAVLAIVGLIILLVLVILQGKREPRSDGIGAEPVAPSKPEESKVAMADPPAPTPVPDQPPLAPPANTAKSGPSRSGHHVAAVSPHERAPREKPASNPPRPAGAKPGPVGARPNPFDESKAVAQAQITAVVRNPANQAALKSCYERALKMDNHLTSGRIDVTVSVGASGTVQRVVINAPASFILVEPCIKSAVKRWVFPSNTEEYATNFPLIMQGGM